jgi:rfaE bifunctional protein kinase chain/domain
MKGRRVAVVGDLMLDRYIWGSVSRISPEAPVPVIEMETEQTRLGGAANVAMNIKSLGGVPVLVGVVGSDGSGAQLMNAVRESGFVAEGIVVDPGRPTTVKTRVIAYSQHVVRIDREMRSDIAPAIQRDLLACLTRHIDTLDAVIIEDYNKGVVVASLIQQIIRLARERGKTVTVDPKYNNFFEYKDVSVFKPNRKETEEALGVRLRTEEDINAAGRIMLERLRCQNVLLTLGELGMVLFEADGAISHEATKARNVQDVSGAGDTVVSALTMALASGAGIREASTLANFAGGVVCGHVGIVPITSAALRDAVLRPSNHQPGAPAS